MPQELTVIICSRRALTEVERLVSILRDQTIAPAIWLWNYNKQHYFPGDTADWVSNHSGAESLRNLPALYHIVETPFICRMDDDDYPTDPDLLADAVAVLADKRQSRLVIGPYGVEMLPGRSYQQSRHVSITKGHGRDAEGMSQDVPVDIVKGRLQLFSAEGARLLRAEYSHQQDDLYTCARLAGARRNYHLASRVFYHQDVRGEPGMTRLLSFQPLPVDFYVEQDRMAERDRVAQSWLTLCDRENSNDQTTNG